MAQPIHSAARHGDVETLRRLLTEGVSPDALGENQVRRTPLHCLFLGFVAEGDRVACLKLLRDAGANLEASDYIGYRPLHFAANSASVEEVSLLVQARVNVDATSNNGTTALHLAARRDSADCIEVLLAAGASLNLRDVNGKTPFGVALLRAHPSLWPVFLRAGAEIPTKCENLTHPYIVRVSNAGGFQRYAQAHVARIASILETPLLPPELVRKVLGFWLHAGYY